MKLAIITALIAVCGAAKLDRSYLPPPSAKTAGGSPGAIQTPFGESFLSNGNQGLGGLPKGGYSNEFQGVVVDAAAAGTRAAGPGDSGLGAPRPSYGFEASKVGDAAFRGAPVARFRQQVPNAEQSSDDVEINAALDGQVAGTQTSQRFDQPSFVQSDRPERPNAEQDRRANILRFDSEVGTDSFSYAFETDNGITAEENGVATNGVNAQGAFSYTGDDGRTYSVRYTADERGYQPVGDHLPTPPPIPEAILKSIEQNQRDEAAGLIDDGSYNAEKYNAGSDYNESDSANGQYNSEPSNNGSGNQPILTSDATASGTFIQNNAQPFSQIQNGETANNIKEDDSAKTFNNYNRRPTAGLSGNNNGFSQNEKYSAQLSSNSPAKNNFAQSSANVYNEETTTIATSDKDDESNPISNNGFGQQTPSDFNRYEQTAQSSASVVPNNGLSSKPISGQGSSQTYKNPNNVLQGNRPETSFSQQTAEANRFSSPSRNVNNNQQVAQSFFSTTTNEASKNQFDFAQQDKTPSRFNSENLEYLPPVNGDLQRPSQQKYQSSQISSQSNKPTFTPSFSTQSYSQTGSQGNLIGNQKTFNQPQTFNSMSSFASSQFAGASQKSPSFGGQNRQQFSQNFDNQQNYNTQSTSSRQSSPSFNTSPSSSFLQSNPRPSIQNNQQSSQEIIKDGSQTGTAFAFFNKKQNSYFEAAEPILDTNADKLPKLQYSSDLQNQKPRITGSNLQFTQRPQNQLDGNSSNEQQILNTQKSNENNFNAQQQTAYNVQNQDEAYYYSQPSKTFHASNSQQQSYSQNFPSPTPNQFNRVNQESAFSAQSTAQISSLPKQQSFTTSQSNFQNRQGTTRYPRPPTLVPVQPTKPTQTETPQPALQYQQYNGVTQASASAFFSPTSSVQLNAQPTVPQRFPQRSSMTRYQQQNTKIDSSLDQEQSQPTIQETLTQSIPQRTTAVTTPFPQKPLTTFGQSTQNKFRNPFSGAQAIKPSNQQFEAQSETTEPSEVTPSEAYEGEIYEYKKPAETLPASSSDTAPQSSVQTLVQSEVTSPDNSDVASVQSAQDNSSALNKFGAKLPSNRGNQFGIQSSSTSEQNYGPQFGVQQQYNKQFSDQLSNQFDVSYFQADDQSSRLTAGKGEVFGGPRKPPSYDDKTGYHY